MTKFTMVLLSLVMIVVLPQTALAQTGDPEGDPYESSDSYPDSSDEHERPNEDDGPRLDNAD